MNFSPAELLKGALQLLWNRRWKMLFFPVWVSAAAVLLFPYEDLSLFVTTAVGKATAGRAFVSLSKLGFSFGFPVAFRAEDVSVEVEGFPTIEAQAIRLVPALNALIHRQALGSLELDGFLGGSFEVRLGSAGTSEDSKNPVRKISIVGEAREISPKEIFKLIKKDAPFQASNVSFRFDMVAPENFSSLPSGGMDFTLKQLKTSDVNVGPFLSLPRMQLGDAKGKAKLDPTRLNLENVEIGDEKSDMNLKLSGLVLLQGGGLMPVRATNYDLKIDLGLRSEMLRSDLGKVLSEALPQFCRGLAASSGHYRFTVKGDASQPSLPPACSPAS